MLLHERVAVTFTAGESVGWTKDSRAINAAITLAPIKRAANSAAPAPQTNSTHPTWRVGAIPFTE